MIVRTERRGPVDDEETVRTMARTPHAYSRVKFARSLITRERISAEASQVRLAGGAMVMSIVEARLEILKAEYHRLEQYLHTLSPEALQHHSACDQWTVADVIAHLTGGSRSHATWIIEALHAERASTRASAASITPTRRCGSHGAQGYGVAQRAWHRAAVGLCCQRQDD